MRRAYVAGSSADLSRARAAMTALRMAGLVVTSTWVDAIEAAGSANEGLSPAVRRFAAAGCEAEVESSHALLLLVPSAPSGIGCGWEAGLARGLGLHMVAAGRTERTVFASLCDVEAESDADAIASIVRWAGGAG